MLKKIWELINLYCEYSSKEWHERDDFAFLKDKTRIKEEIKNTRSYKILYFVSSKIIFVLQKLENTMFFFDEHPSLKIIFQTILVILLVFLAKEAMIH